jgi:succinate dehydrogenase / fumarate reductase cytochrome b subunit
MRLPITAYVSILHRVSGVAIFFGLSVLLWCLDKSLESPQGFLLVKNIFVHPIAQVIIWGVLSALSYHMVMGIRHLVMDAGYGETYEAGRVTALTSATIVACIVGFLAYWVFF